MKPKPQNKLARLPAEELFDFVENASIPLHWIDKKGIVIWANQAELETLGYTYKEYVGFPISNFHADPEVIDDIFARLNNNETLLNYKARLKCKDGSIKHVLINSNVYRKENEFIHTRCFTRDVSDMVIEAERKAELLRKLEENEEELKMSREIIASSYDAIISKDLNGIVTSWNKSAEETFGYTADEMIGKPTSILLPIDRLYEENEIYHRLRKGERVHHFETQRVAKNHSVIDVSLTISPIRGKQGNMIGLSKIVRDISEKKQEEIRKNSFVSMVSHELKTPLTSMLAYLQILLAKARKTDDVFSISALTKTELQAQKMVSMVQNFLNIGRLEDGKIRLNKEHFDINTLIQEIVWEISMVTRGHTIEYLGCEELKVYGDRDKIGHVLTNLINNGIKYSPKHYSVQILCETVVDQVTISVVDKGIGISAKDQKKLFEKYYRAESEVVGTISGFGIGLYLVAEILRMHDTTIQVNSEEGSGSRFSFSLPIK